MLAPIRKGLGEGQKRKDGKAGARKITGGLFTRKTIDMELRNEWMVVAIFPSFEFASDVIVVFEVKTRTPTSAC